MTDTAVQRTELAPPVDGPPLAHWSRRVLAALLDGAILSGATWLLLGSTVAAPSLTPHAPLTATPPDGPVHSPLEWHASPWLVALVLAMLALQGWTGATPGKRVAGIAVVRASDGLPAGLLVSAVRVVAHVLDAILLIGYLRPLVHTRRQTFADSIVGTLAVQTREPPAHPWFVRFRREPSALGSTLVTVAAVAVCVLGVGFTTATGSGGTGWESTVTCTDDPTLAGRTAFADVTRTGGTSFERRWWVSRVVDRDVDTDLRITWTWTSPRGTGDGLVETDLVRADGSTIDVTQVVTRVESTSGAATFDPARVPVSDLVEAGPGWTARTRLVVNGATVGTCTVESADWDAADRG